MADPTRYLLALYVAEQREGVPVPPGEVAAAVGRSPAATTEMLQRLEERGIVTYEPYEGATLTADGRERAAELYGTYRNLARFFDEVLGVAEHEREAMRVAGHLSPAVAERLAATLLDARDADADATPTLPEADGP